MSEPQPIELHIDTMRHVAALVRNLSPEALSELSTLLPVCGMTGVMEVIADTIEELSEQLAKEAQ